MNYLRRHLRDIPEEHRSSALELLARVLDDLSDNEYDDDDAADRLTRDARMIQQELKHR